MAYQPFSKYSAIADQVNPLMQRPTGRPTGVVTGMGMQQVRPQNPALAGMAFSRQAPIGGTIRPRLNIPLPPGGGGGRLPMPQPPQLAPRVPELIGGGQTLSGQVPPFLPGVIRSSGGPGQILPPPGMNQTPMGGGQANPLIGRILEKYGMRGV